MPKENKPMATGEFADGFKGTKENGKSECLDRMKFANRAEVEQAVAEYVQFYNFERIDLKNGLTPIEIRSKAV